MMEMYTIVFHITLLTTCNSI